jgi:hypothetical protein
MVYLKIETNIKDTIKLYHNHHIIYLNGKNNYQIQLDFDIDNLYIEIDKKRLIFNMLKLDATQIKNICINDYKIMISIKKKSSIINLADP